LLDKRLVFVTGKGGVGKSTVAMALGIIAARRGLRTIVAELASQERVTRAFGHEPAAFVELELAPGLHTISIDPQRAMEEYLKVKAGLLAPLLSSSRIFQYLAAATPGMRELLTIGKVWELAQPERRTAGGARYDLVVVDAPASGHGLGMLRTPRTYGDIARVGPIRRQTDKIWDFISDPDRTGYLAVALPEEMPVVETLEFEEKLADQIGVALDAIVVNAMFPQRFSAADARRLEEKAAGDGTDPATRAALAAALSEHRRAKAQQAQLRRLRRDARAPVLTLPFLFEPQIDLEGMRRLAQELERRLRQLGSAARNSASPSSRVRTGS
jgi:anion-transporting  ArsA/GET3 family ATPase